MTPDDALSAAEMLVEVAKQKALDGKHEESNALIYVAEAYIDLYEIHKDREFA
jgi:hypothetical protein